MACPSSHPSRHLQPFCESAAWPVLQAAAGFAEPTPEVHNKVASVVNQAQQMEYSDQMGEALELLRQGGWPFFMKGRRGSPAAS